ncbi:dihydrodipicolinate reductase [Mycolicibacterium pyrenivorans]|uniref:dihydrodipicolinate reductase n=1 Tax=Mycolicibacterium pyrenivorans TaxID=187102 RepID=UPI0021F33505|nr:dihydrodipicolinate reductase [Mycolicibacterium pyrenivorans]MCV7151369.1 hypothetical protein [Mycolicibacterium pyrenivorans]
MRRGFQWATGVVGQHTICGIVNQSTLELVGALVYSGATDGNDLGEICGIGSLKVKATKDRDTIIAMDADRVLYAAIGEPRMDDALDDICALLESGENIISMTVAGLISPKAMGRRSPAD